MHAGREQDTGAGAGGLCPAEQGGRQRAVIEGCDMEPLSGRGAGKFPGQGGKVFGHNVSVWGRAAHHREGQEDGRRMSRDGQGCAGEGVEKKRGLAA